MGKFLARAVAPERADGINPVRERAFDVVLAVADHHGIGRANLSLVEDMGEKVSLVSPGAVKVEKYRSDRFPSGAIGQLNSSHPLRKVLNLIVQEGQ